MENQNCQGQACQSPSQCQSQSACASPQQCGQPSMGQQSGCQQSPCASMCDCHACKMMFLAKEAKMNVLVRKMEAVIEKEHGAKLDKEARLLVEHFMKIKELKMDKKSAFKSEMEQFHEAMMANWKA